MVAPVEHGKVYRIVDWIEHYETGYTLKADHPKRVLIPTKFGDGLLELLDHERGREHHSTWILLVCLVMQGRKGRDGTLRADTGRPHTPETLSARLPGRPSPELVRETLDRVRVLGWVDELDGISPADGGQMPRNSLHEEVKVGNGKEKENGNRSRTVTEEIRARGASGVPGPDAVALEDEQQPDRAPTALGPHRDAWRPGRSLEWDRCIQLAERLQLDGAARRRLSRSSVDDNRLYMLLRDASEMRPPLKNASQYVTAAVSGMEREANHA